MHIRVVIDITKPLKRYVNLNIGAKGMRMVYFSTRG